MIHDLGSYRSSYNSGRDHLQRRRGWFNTVLRFCSAVLQAATQRAADANAMILPRRRVARRRLLQGAWPAGRGLAVMAHAVCCGSRGLAGRRAGAASAARLEPVRRGGRSAEVAMPCSPGAGGGRAAVPEGGGDLGLPAPAGHGVPGLRRPRGVCSRRRGEAARLQERGFLLHRHPCRCACNLWFIMSVFISMLIMKSSKSGRRGFIPLSVHRHQLATYSFIHTFAQGRTIRLL